MSCPFVSRLFYRCVSSFLIVLAFLFIIAGPTFAQRPIRFEHPPRTADMTLDNPATWAVVGAETFTPDQIRTSLRRDWQVAMTDSPGDNLSRRIEYTKMLTEKIKAGYHRAGFRDAHVVVGAFDKKASKMIVFAKSSKDDLGFIVINLCKYLDENDDTKKLMAHYDKEGYVSFGEQIFYNPKVVPPLECSPHIMIRVVKEGPRYRQGDILVVGSDKVDKEAIVAALRTSAAKSLAAQPGCDRATISDVGLRQWRSGMRNKESDSSDPHWQPGKPCPFDKDGTLMESAGQKIERSISDALAAQGYFDADFAWELVSDESTAMTDLKITIRSLGRKAKLGKIELVGLKRHGEQTLREFLGLKLGVKINRARMIELAERLFECGRFVDFRIAISPMEEDDSLSVLRIRVLEHGTVPLLGEPLSREAEALLRMFRELDFNRAAKSDLIASLQGAQGELARLVVSPGSGVALAVNRKEAKAGAQRPLSVAAILEPKAWTYYGIDRKVHYRIPFDLPGIEVSGLIRIDEVERHPLPTTKSEDDLPVVELLPYQGRVTFGIEGSTSIDKTSPVQVMLSYEPCAILDMVYRPTGLCTSFEMIEGESSHKIIGDYGGGGGLTIEIDAATGRLIRLKMEGGDADGREDLDAIEKFFCETIRVMEIGFEEKGYDRLCKRIESAAVGSRDLFDSQRLTGSLLEAIADESWVRRLAVATGIDPAEFDQTRGLWRHMWAPAADAALIDLVEMFDFKFGAEADDRFVIPSGLGSQLTQSLAGIQWFAALTSPRFCSMMIYVYADELMPRESWPWRISRAVALITSGEGDRGGGILQEMLQDPKTGPLSILAVSLLLEKDFPDAARYFAQVGLQRTDDVRFRFDCQPLVDRRGALGRFVLRAAAMLETMPDKELTALIESLPKPYQKPLRLAAEELRRDTDRTDEAAATAALEAAWRGGLCELVEMQLFRIYKTGPPLTMNR